jgi:glycosyltransferase involved in cell wall biosynthesis
LAIVDEIAAHLGENDDPDCDPAYRQLRNWLRRTRDASAPRVERASNARKAVAPRVARWIRRYGLPIGRSAYEHAPHGARYVNVSQYPLSVEGAYGGFARRPDIKLAFFVHDLLPLEWPEYFKLPEHEKHKRRLRNLAEVGAGAIVSTQAVKSELTRRLVDLGRADMPILRAKMPISAAFLREEAADEDLAGSRYFVLCGTIEPRKNHLMILHVWRELVRRRGAAAPTLVLVGARGWKNQNVLDLLDHCQQLRGRVLEVSGLPTPSLKRVLRSAIALLMPSFAEGYGLPIVEALCVGTPVIASDIPVFREIAGESFVALSPIDGEGWLRTVELFADGRMSCGRPPAARPSQTDLFVDVDDFLAKL